MSLFFALNLLSLSQILISFKLNRTRGRTKSNADERQKQPFYGRSDLAGGPASTLSSRNPLMDGDFSPQKWSLLLRYIRGCVFFGSSCHSDEAVNKLVSADASVCAPLRCIRGTEQRLGRWVGGWGGRVGFRGFSNRSAPAR